MRVGSSSVYRCMTLHVVFALHLDVYIADMMTTFRRKQPRGTGRVIQRITCRIHAELQIERTTRQGDQAAELHRGSLCRMGR